MPNDLGISAPPPLTPDEQHDILIVLLEHTRIGARLLELLDHGWGHLDIIVAEHKILKSHLTKTDV